ncbi:MAG: hypothetical protein HC767_09500 [Akkermansiaceae bacterium]|nr:hypothetical protein [Akkermansiaceae bacterium]
MPLRRSLANESVADHTKQIGLRIESNVERQSQSDEDPALRLEIQEINGSTMRLEEAIPSPEKVPRVVVFREKGTRVKNPKSDQAADETWGKSKKQSLRWMLYNGGGVIALVVLMIALLPLVRSIQRPTPKLKEVKLQIDTKTENEENELGAMSFFIGKEKEAMGLLDRYLHASSIDDVIPLVVDGESQREIIGRHWKPLKDLQSHQLKPDESLEVYHVDDAAYGILRATLPDQSIYIAYFAKLGDRLLLDWKASSKYSSASLKN